MRITIAWTASEGALLWLNGNLSGIPSVKLESVGADAHWNVTFDKLGEPGYAARHAVISAGDLDQLIDNLGRGHGLAITVARAGQAPLRYLDSPGDRPVAVAMYRACVKSLSQDPPPRYSKWPGMYLFQLVDDAECGFRHIFSDRPFPPYISLWVDATHGRVAFERQTFESTPHGKITRRRKTPDRVNAEALFGGIFELVESFDHELTLAQVDSLAADLEHGVARKVAMTSPDGETLVLPFGGPYSKASAAMMGACRQVKFGSPGNTKQ